jgi:hypothetical protein
MKNAFSFQPLARFSLLSAVVLLIANPFVPAQVHAYLSSLPLALAGLGYIFLQIGVKPARRVLLKRLVLAAAFLLWAVVQLLPAGRTAVFLGDIVIAAYVLDLFWMMQDQQEGLRPATTPAPAEPGQSRSDTHERTARIVAGSCAD